MRKSQVIGILLLVGISTVFVGFYAYGQRVENGQEDSDQKTAGDRSAGNPVKLTPKSIEAGKKAFQDKCEVCHGEKADGTGEMATMLDPKPANLTDPRKVGKMTDKEVFDFITRGKDAMPKFADLPEEVRWNLVNFVRSVEAKRVEGGNESGKGK
ncbi:MAG: c-type cytochrome [Acidobacteriia bacterium]|nr:c-type cytochrome [Terriglobia bacterium]